MSKYTDMIREQEAEGDKLARAGWGPEHAEIAADWRAMREAWEAMVEACGDALLCWGSMDYDESPFRRETIAKVRAALAKARVE